MEDFIPYFLVSIAVGCVFGAINVAVLKNKGYPKSEQWGGFFLGVLLSWIALIICCCKKNLNEEAIRTQQKRVLAADELVKYKKLLDSGVITQEEFDKKKKELL